jgi:anti-sigma factor RsiW
MKESKFIELLNLYVDHHISPAEAALLEAEVRANPARHRIYREYCQMQRACSELAENFRSEAPAGDAKRVDFSPRRRAGTIAYATSLLAVAAGIAVVFAVRSRLPEKAAAAPETRIAAMPVKSSPATVTTTIAARPALQPVFGPGLATMREQTTNLADAALEQAALAEWMNNIQLSSLTSASSDDLRFDTTATVQPEVRTYRTGRPIQGKVEWTAFTFQK